MRSDGDVVLFKLEAKLDKDWFSANYDHFGSPAGFTASDDGWQKTGIFGTFDEEEGMRALLVMSKQHVEYSWRLMRLKLSQHHFEVATMAARKPGGPRIDWRTNNTEMRRRVTAIQKGSHVEGI